MDLQSLKYFYTVAQEKSFLGASHKLGYAQSNLSVRIQQLEKEMGTELFIRNSSGVSLTEKGMILFRYAEKLLTLSEEATSAVKGNSIIRDVLRIGSMESSAVSFLPHLLSEFHSANPQVKVSVSTANSKLLIHRLLNREIDCAFVAGPSEHSELLSVHVKRELLALLTAEMKKEVKNIRQLLNLPLVVFPYGCSYRQILEDWLKDENIVSNQIVEMSSLGSIIASVSAGLGIALLPESAINMFTAAQSLSLLEVPEKYRTVEIKFIYKKNQWNDVVLNSIVEIIKSVFHD